jgi:hypothetical protein
MQHHRRLARRTGALAIAAAAAVPGIAQASTYADNQFTNGSEGYADAGTVCEVDVANLIEQLEPLPEVPLPSPACTGETRHSTVGNPAGSLATEVRPAAQALGLVTNAAAFDSPPFAVTEAPQGDPALTFDRAYEVEAVLSNGTDANTLVQVVKLGTDAAGAPTEEVVHTATLAPRTVEPEDGGGLIPLPGSLVLGAARTSFSNEALAIPAAALAKGSSYKLRFVTTTTANVQAALPRLIGYYDNIKLTAVDGPASVDTLDPKDVGRVAPTSSLSKATFTSAVVQGTPAGNGTTVAYRYGTDPQLAGATTTPAQALDTATGNPVTVTDLQPGRTYFVQAVATTTYGTGTGATTGETLGDVESFFVPANDGTNGATGATGATGSTGATGTAGTPGAVGPQGPQGVAGAQGGQGPQGTAGTRGATGSTGATGPAGPRGVQGSTRVIELDNGDERALLVIRSNRVVVATKGRLRQVTRFPIFCRKSTGRACAGTVKLRTVERINPATRGTRPSRRVTFTTFEYQLAAGKAGFAKATLDRQKFDKIVQLGSVLVDASVQVTDAEGNRQVITRRVRMVTRKTL